MAKKKLTIEDVLVPKDEIPYDVPENWCWVKLDTVAQWSSGGTPSTKVPEYYDGDIPWVVIGDLNDGEVYTAKKNITEVGLSKSSAKWVDIDSVLIAMYGASIGKIGINKIRCTTNQAIAFTKEIYNVTTYKYIYYYLLNIRERLIGLGKGGAQPNISQTVIKEEPIPLPPLAEQERIVNRIESLFDKVDKAAELVDEARVGFEKRRAAILERAFSGELTRKWREDNGVSYDSAKFLDRIKKERLGICQTKKELSDITKMFEEGNFIDDKYPKGWLNLKANMICHNITCGKTPSGKVSEEKGEIPFLKVANIVDNKVDFMYKTQYIDKETNDTKLKSSIVIPGDVIMNIVGPPLRKVAIVPDDYSEWNINQNISRFRMISRVLPKYVYYCLIHEETLREALNLTRGVVGQIIINVSIVRTLNIPIPSIEEQKEIVKHLDSMLENENKVEELTSLKDSVDTIKKSILAKAFRGDIGSNYTDEESSRELLKEIIK